MNVKNQMKLRRLIAVAFGILEYDKMKFYGKSAVIKYLHEISTYFDETYFVPGYIKNGKEVFNSELDTTKVIPVRISYTPKKKSLGSLFVNLIKDQIKLIKLITKDSTIIIDSTMIWFTPILLFLPLLSGHLACYVASDHRSVSKFQYSKKSIFDKVKSRITLLFGELTLRISDSILVRGDSSRYKKYGKDHVYESQPIISLINDYPLREDTCQTESITILYVGRLLKIKGISVLLEAFSKISKNQVSDKNRFTLKIVGNGEEYHFLRIRAQELEILEKTLFLGWIDDDALLAKEYLSSDIFVLPSLKFEGSPRVINEAMYYCLPIITTDLGYGSSLIHKEDVYFIKPNSIKELEIAIKEIISNDKLRTRLIKNGRKRMKQNYTSTARQHAEIIKRTSL
jgi:glycosyltransferase involved in cell wall biosynthesis